MKRIHTNWVTLLLLAMANTVLASNVPVFRYALEKWPAREVYLTVGLAKTPPLRDRNLMKSFEAASQDQLGPCNFRLRLEYYQVSSHISIAALNPNTEDVAPFYTAKLNEETLKRVLSSPVRSKIASELLAGKAAVWLYIEDNTTKTSVMLADLLEQEAKRLTLRNQKQAADIDKTMPHMDTPLPVAFSLQTLKLDKTTQAAEAVLLGQLADLSPGMTITPGSLFCITGRGLIIAAFGPEGITKETVTSVCEFLAAPYSSDLQHLKDAPALLLRGEWGKVVPLIITQTPLAPVTAPPAEPSPAAPAVGAEKELPKLPAAPATRPIPGLDTDLAPDTLIDKIPWIYLVGVIMIGWIGFMFYRIKQEYDSQKRMKDEEDL